MRRNKFIKTKHFKLRQHERNIHNYELDKILRKVKKNLLKETMVVVTKRLLKKLGLKSNSVLVIIIVKKKLITLYYASLFETLKKRSTDKKNSDLIFI